MAEGRGIGPLRPKTLTVYKTASSTNWVPSVGCPPRPDPAPLGRKDRAIANYFLTTPMGSRCVVPCLIIFIFRFERISHLWERAGYSRVQIGISWY